jgi:hypothetical protein
MATAVSRPKTPRLPSEKELVAAIRAATPGLRIYSPADHWLNPEVHGRTDIWIPPDLGGAVEPHPITGEPVVCDGTATIKGRYLTQKDSSGKVIEGQDAEAVVRFLISPANYGQMGVVWIPGTAEDEGIKQEARDLYAEYQRAQDESIVARRAEFKTNWVKNPAHSGEPCPPPTDTESAASDRLQEHKRRRQYQYECDAEGCPGYAQNDWAKFARHMLVSHKVKVERESYEEVTGVVAAQAPKRGPGRPRKTPVPVPEQEV